MSICDQDLLRRGGAGPADPSLVFGCCFLSARTSNSLPNHNVSSTAKVHVHVYQRSGYWDITRSSIPGTVDFPCEQIEKGPKNFKAVGEHPTNAFWGLRASSYVNSVLELRERPQIAMRAQ